MYLNNILIQDFPYDFLLNIIMNKYYSFITIKVFYNKLTKINTYIKLSII